MYRIDEDSIEAAFWNFDAERTRTGAERDAFKHQLRLVVRAHLAPALEALEDASLCVIASLKSRYPPEGHIKTRMLLRTITSLLVAEEVGAHAE